MIVDPLEALTAKLGYEFKDKDLLVRALTHRSFVNESSNPKTADNERLEFLGDAVIDLIVSTVLMERFPSAREGTLSRIRASMVSEPGLAKLARALGVGDALRLGRGEELSGGRDRSSLLADAFEAVIAALYLDAGFERTREILVLRLEIPSEETRGQGDPKTELQERLQGRLHQTPSYRVVAEAGPDHDKTFRVQILLKDRVLGEGAGRTKKEAEQAAARACLADFDRLFETA